MAINFSGFGKGIFLKPIDSGPDAAVADPTDNIEGSFWVYQSKLKVYVNAAIREIATLDETQIFTNKSIDADNNTITELETDNLKAGVLITSTIMAGASDTTIPSALAIKTYIDDAILTKDEASEIAFDNTTSGLTATNVQTAIDEVEGRLDTAETGLSDHLADTADAHDASAISLLDSGANYTATEVEAALAEVKVIADAAATSTDLSNHLSDATDAHDASAVSNVPSGNLAATDVQGALNEIQSELDGVGSGSQNTIYTQNFNDDNPSDLTAGANRGKSATFDGGGTFGGTITDYTAFPFEGTQTLYYKQAAGTGSENDYFHFGTIPIEDVQKGEFINLTFHYALEETSGMHVVIYDDTNNVKLDSHELTKVFASPLIRKRFSTEVYVPTNCSALKIGFHQVGTPTGSQDMFVDKLSLSESVSQDRLTTSTEIIQVAHGFTVGQSVYHDSSVPEWKLAKADAIGTVPQYVITSVPETDNFYVKQTGETRIVGHGFTIGEYYFTSEATAGLSVSTEPSTGFSCPIFYVRDADTIIVNVQKATSVDGIAASNVVNTPAGDIAATDVQAAINELDTEKQANMSGTTDEIVIAADVVGIADDPILPGTGAVSLPTGTEAQRPGSPTNNMLRYNSDSDEFEGYADNTWGAIGGAGGGGLDVYHTETFDKTLAGDFSTGNNATFLGGGTIQGDLTIITDSSISGTNALRYGQVLGSLNDYFASPVIELDKKQRGNDSGFTQYVTYDGDSGDIKLVVYDVTNGNILTSELDLFENASNPTRMSISFFPPSNCTQIRYGGHVVVENAGQTLKMDDLEFTTDPFVYKNLIDNQYHNFGALASTMTSITSGALRFGTVPTSGVNSLVYDDTTGFFTAIKDVTLDTSLSWRATGTVNAFLEKSDGTITYSNSTNVAGRHETISSTIELKSGDAIRLRVDGTLDSVHPVYLNIHTQSETEHVVTPANVGTEYHKGFSTNFFDITGSTSNFDISQIDLSSSNLVEFNDTTETRLVAKEDIILDVTVFGEVGDAGGVVIYDSSAQFISINYSPATNLLTSASIEIKLSKGDYIYFTKQTGTRQGGLHFTARRTEVNFLAAVPVQKVAYVNPAALGNFYSTNAASTSYKTVGINNISGDTSFMSLSANQITLSSGKYTFEVNPGVISAQWIDFLLYNITDAANEEELLEVSFSNVSTVVNFTTVFLTVELTKATTFEFRTKSDVAGTEYFGRSKIIKLR